MKFGLLSVTYSGLWYAGRALALEEQIRRASDLGFEGLSIETKRPVAHPIDLSREDRRRIRRVAENEGVELCAVESMSNFASEKMEERDNNLAMMREVLRLARDLEIDLVKVFAAWPGIIDDEEETSVYAPYERGSYHDQQFGHDLRRWRRAVEGIREVSHWAEDLGITLVLQNHAPVLRPGYEDALAMVREIDRPNVKLCIDAPLFDERQSDGYVREAVRECGDDILLTHFGSWNFAAGEDGEPVQEIAPNIAVRVNYEAFVAALAEIGYDGYLLAEYCLPCLRDHQLAGIEAVDEQTRLSLEYMQDVVRRVSVHA